MAVQPVLGEADTHMLRNTHRDGVVRLPVTEDGAQLLAHGVLPGAGEIADLLLRDGDHLQCELVALLELTVHVDHGAAVLPFKRRAQDGLVHAVAGGDGGVEAQIVQIGAVPDGVGAVAAGDLGEDAAVEACTVGKGDLLDDAVFHHEAKTEGPGLLGQTLHRGILLKGDGLGLAVNRQAVETGVVRRDKVVVLINARAAAGNCARKLGLFPDIHQGVAA